MRTQVEKPKVLGSTLQSKPKASRQAPISDILQAYAKNNLMENVQKKEQQILTLNTQFSTNEVAQRENVKDDELLQGIFNSQENKVDKIDMSDTIQKKRKSDGEIIKTIPKSDYSESIEHIDEYLGGREQDFTIDRPGTAGRRRQSLKGIPTVKRLDRDECPMAMFSEGGTGSSVKYIDPSDNRGSGSTIGHALRQYPDGEQITFSIEIEDGEDVLQL